MFISLRNMRREHPFWSGVFVTGLVLATLSAAGGVAIVAYVIIR